MHSFLGSEIKELLGEIGNLSHLKLLDLSECFALQHIPPGLLSSLSTLEELYMGNVSVNWEPTDGNRDDFTSSYSKHQSWALYQDSLAFVKACPVELVQPSLLNQENVPQGIQGFLNLTSIDVFGRHKLRYLFPPTIAKLLVELQSIKIWWCDMIENIVQRDGEEEAEDIILLPKITSFDLSSLPNLMSFCIEPYSFEWSSMEKIYLHECSKFKTYGKLQKINWELDSIPQDQEPCLECIPRGRNDSPMVGSNQGTTKKFQESSSVNKEGILTKDPRANDIDNNSKT
ncbi:uncharacterized protein LOC126691388 [Quercus robur]|uniref:uncharacterized protein LOC126691388 n=1 Tax=Quercus robur TaxID=38942 RepID=UPI002162B2DB|nr:uncharacterized protein LOC126691388 [Quercus robur]